MRLLLSFLLVLSSGCTLAAKCIKGRALLDQFNQKAPATDPPFTSCEDDVAAVLKDTLADAYASSSSALAPISPDGGAPDVLATAVQCLRAQKANGQDDRACLACVLGEGTCKPALSFPAAPALSEPSAEAWRGERDVERLQHGLELAVRAVAQSCAVTQGAGTAADPAAEHAALQAHFTAGLRRLSTYVSDRGQLRREERPVTAWVLAGGAANGAFSAGAVWWLLSNHHGCATCGEDRVDMVGGASTGTLISTLVKNYFAAGQGSPERARTLDLLAGAYTCSTNADLYCVQDVSLYDLALAEAPDKRGLVKFDGVRALLERNIGAQPHLKAAPEQFASTVDYESGRVFHLSSVELSDPKDWLDALEGSIVEPFVAEPVKRAGSLRGTLIDGGVRSGLPLSTALRRGADRAVVFVNTATEGTPLARVPRATSILFRSIELFSLQPILGELALAEHARVLRRQAEKERCLTRLGYDAAGAGAVGLEQRCSRASAAPEGVLRAKRVAPVTQPATPTLERLVDRYQSSWLFMPSALPARWSEVSHLAAGSGGAVTWKDLGAVGYQFNPNEMWNLFALGALVAQQRCPELMATLGWSLTCPTEDQAVQALQGLYGAFTAKGCGARPLELRDCGQPVP